MPAESRLQIVISARDEASQVFKGLQGNMKRYGEEMTRVGKRMTMGLTLPIAGMGILAVKTFTDFQQSLANTASVAGATGKDLKALEKTARDMGKTTIFSATQAAEAMYYLASAGLDTRKVTETLPAVLELAAATGSDLAFSAEMVVGRLGAFNLTAAEAGRVVNTMAAGISRSQLTMERLADFMPYAQATAQRFNWTIEETVALGGVLSEVWGPKMAMAGAGLEAMFRRLTKEDEKAIEVLEKYGLTIDAVSPVTNDLAIVVERLVDANFSAADSMVLFGDQGSRVFETLRAVGGESLRVMIEGVTGTTKASEMAEIQLNTLQGSLRLLKSAVEEVFLTFAAELEPILRSLVENYLKPAADAVADLNKEQKIAIMVIMGLVAVIGPLLMLLGFMAMSFAAITPLALAVGLAVSSVIVFLTLLIVKFDDVRWAVEMMGVWFRVQFSGIKREALALWEKIKFVGNWIAWIFEVRMISAAKWLDEQLVNIWNSIKNTIGEAIDWIVSKIEGFISTITRAISTITGFMGGIGGRIGGILGGGQFGIPYVPRTGAYLLHKGEAVVPARTRIGSGITVNIYGGYYLSEEAAEEMGDLIIKKLKRNLRI